MIRALILLAVLLSLVGGFAGCQRASKQAASSEVMVVPVSHPAQRQVTDFVEFTGRTNARDSVSIVPRVTGYLIKMPFREGSDVTKDDVLFEVDPGPYQAQFEAAKAQVALNEASVRYAVATNERFKTLAKKQPGAVSDRELDQYQALQEQAEANLKLANANLMSAKLNLNWTKVTSPIDGRVSRYFLTPGNLVNQDVTQLTTVVSMEQMYVYFDMDEATFMRLNRATASETRGLLQGTGQAPSRSGSTVVGLLSSAQGGGPLLAASAMAAVASIAEIPVEMGLQGDEGYPHKGTINFIDNQVNPATGSIPVRGVFPNPQLARGRFLLVPGMFVRIRLPIGEPHMALLVIDRAVTTDQGIKYVYVIDAENKVQQRRVTIGSLEDDGLRVISEGLEPTDWVVIGSLPQIRPRMTIRPDYVTMPSLATPAAKAAAPSTAPKGKK